MNKIFEINTDLLKKSKNLFLAGDNDFLYLFIKDKIKSIHPDSEIYIFDCSNKIELQEAIESLSNLTLFSNKKITILKNIDSISEKLINTFVEIFQNNLESENLILGVDNNFLSFDYRTKKNLLKSKNSITLSKNCQLIDISTPFESDMIRWISFFENEKNITISSKLKKDLVSIFGTNFHSIYNEITKISYLIESKIFSYDEWYQSISNSHKNKQLWEFNYAVLDKKLHDILLIGNSLYLQYGMNFIISSLFQIFEALFFNHLNDGTNVNPMHSSLKPNILKRVSLSHKNFEMLEIENALIALYEADKKQKQRRNLDDAEFVKLIVEIFSNE
jgi:DNA polymerase III delta subunit